MKHRGARWSVALAMVATIGLSACGDDDDADTDDPVDTSAGASDTTAGGAEETDAATDTTAAPEDTTAGGTDTTVATPVGGDGEILIQDFAFQVPASIGAGTDVAVTNADSARHTITDKDEAFDVEVDGSGTATLNVPDAGTYSIYCKIHPSMLGTLTVA